MCVIMIAEEKPLSKAMIKKANMRNPHGIGMAWIDGGRVRYRKGITLREALELRVELPRPYVFHARWATEGKPVDELCHPFPVTRRDLRKTTGRSRRVLFHNGHWNQWAATVQRVEQRYDLTLPDGHMSDSRAMAWLVAILGPGILDMKHGQKVAVLDSDVGVQRYGAGWTKWRGYWVSNLRWQTLPIASRVKDGNNGWWTVPTLDGGWRSVRAANEKEAMAKAHRGRPADSTPRRDASQVTFFTETGKKKRQRGVNPIGFEKRHGGGHQVRHIDRRRVLKDSSDAELLDWFNEWKKDERLRDCRLTDAEEFDD